MPGIDTTTTTRRVVTPRLPRARTRATALGLPASCALLALYGCVPDVPCGAFPEDAGSGLVASVCVRSTVADVPQCDGQVILEGTPSSVECPECTFAFDVESTIVRDDGTDCPWWPEVTWAHEQGSLVLAHMDDFEVYLYDNILDYHDALVQGEPYGDHRVAWTPIAAGEDLPGSRFVVDGDTFTWTLDTVSAYEDYATHSFDAYCEGGRDHAAAAASTSVRPVEGDLPLRAWYTDAWVTHPEAGAHVTVSADNVAADTAACWSFRVNREDGCTLSRGQDDVACEIPPVAAHHACPAVSFVADGGPYTIWIDQEPCAQNVGPVRYALRADADGVALPLTQSADDVEDEYIVETPVRRTVVMTGRMTR